MIRRLTLVASALALAAAGFGGCSRAPDAPTDQGVCYFAAATKDGKVKFNKVADHIADLEHCAAQLEAMRLRFLRLGGQNSEIAGVYQGTWLFLQREGVYTAQKADGARYLLMVRTGDGRLAVPGAMPQP
jgi:hypothetical protein